jgi:hypothetical protein
MVRSLEVAERPPDGGLQKEHTHTYILSKTKPAANQEGNEIKHTYWYRLRIIQVVSQVKEHIWHKLRHIIWVSVDEGTKSEDSRVAHLE